MEKEQEYREKGKWSERERDEKRGSVRRGERKEEGRQRKGG